MKRFIFLLLIAGLVISVKFFGPLPYSYAQHLDYLHTYSEQEVLNKVLRTNDNSFEVRDRIPWTISTNVVVAISNTVGEVDIAMTGMVTQIHLVVPALTGSHTMTLKLEDAANYELFDSGAKAESATYVINQDVVVPSATITIQCTSSAAENDAAVTNNVVIIGLP